MSKSCFQYQPAWCRCSHKEAEYTDCRHSKVSGHPRPEQSNPSSDVIVKISQQPRFICAIQFSFPFFVTFISINFFPLLREKVTKYQVQECEEILLFPSVPITNCSSDRAYTDCMRVTPDLQRHGSPELLGSAFVHQPHLRGSLFRYFTGVKVLRTNYLGAINIVKQSNIHEQLDTNTISIYPTYQKEVWQGAT